VALDMPLIDGAIGLHEQVDFGADGTHWHPAIATSGIGLWS